MLQNDNAAGLRTSRIVWQPDKEVSISCMYLDEENEDGEELEEPKDTYLFHRRTPNTNQWTISPFVLIETKEATNDQELEI